MKVKIKNKGKTKEFNVIESWKDVTLEKWVKLINNKIDTKGQEAIQLIKELSNIPKDIIKSLELSDIAVIMSRIGELQANQDNTLQKIIEIDGKRYGFLPDLDSITLGEYADIETFIKMDIDKHLPEVMSILYRPIVEEKDEVYTIESYDGEIKLRTQEMKKMTAEQVQSALVFFYTFGITFVKIMKSFLTEKLKATKTQSLQTPSQTNGLGLA